MKINTNPQSLVAQRTVKKVGQERDQVLSQVSSGDRIIQSSIDPAGLAISEKMKANIRSTAMAKRNVGDAVSMLQVAEGSLSVLSEMSSRMRELALQSANDTLGSEDRKMVDLEFQQLKEEIHRTVQKADYNGKKLFTGETDSYDFQVGITAARDNVIGYDVSKALRSINHLGIEGGHVRTKEASQAALSRMDSAMELISSGRATIGSLHGRMNASLQNLGTSEENLAASNSRIRDVDIAQAASEKAKLTIMGEASTATLAQANTRPQDALRLIQ